jgi:colanic acid biosynthesis glycosyl transferase WcaI
MMRIQLWTCDYEPQPSGIAPLAGAIARELASRGHELKVVAAHPHYPEPRWGVRLLPYRETREGVPIVRLPIWPGRGTAARRLRQELTFSGALGTAAPWLGKPDVIVAVSPSFGALGPAMLNARLRRVPWVLWLQDILPDGATATGILREGALIRAARRFERAAYRSARHIVVISDSFAGNLAGKGVPEAKMTRIYNPATHGFSSSPAQAKAGRGLTVLNMGNIGHTQNLVEVTKAFQRSEELEQLGARLVMAGDGVMGDAVRKAISTDRVTVTGVLERERLERELDGAALALVSQSYDGVDFNVPSKLMSFMARGLPVVAAVRANSEVERIIRASGGGWVVSSTSTREFGDTVATALKSPEERARRGEAALSFARAHFSPMAGAAAFEQVLGTVVGGSSPDGREKKAQPDGAEAGFERQRSTFSS